jgi:hypothetical protein
MKEPLNLWVLKIDFTSVMNWSLKDKFVHLVSLKMYKKTD